jgi:predicted DNA-binding transcriptional regulator AlpA
MSENVYLTPKEAAAYIKSSTSTLAKKRLFGGGPRYLKIGQSVRYLKADLDAWMLADARVSTSDTSSKAA